MVGVVLMLATTQAYWSHVNNAGFVYEDTNDVQTQYGGWQGWRVEGMQAWYRPQRALTGLVTRVVGFDPVAQHLAQLLLHLAAGLLLWTVASRLLSPSAAVIAAGVFWLHPLQTEAVAYAAAKSDVLLTLAVLAGCWAVLTDHVGWAWLAACVAVLAKETGVAAFALLPWLAWWAQHRWTPLARAGWALSTICPVLAAWVVTDHRTLATVPQFAAQLADALALLRFVVWPVGLSIAHPPAPIAAGLVALVVVISSAWVVLRVPHGWLTFAGVWTLLALAPRLVVPLYEGPHEHHLYLPMAGLTLAVGYLLMDAPWPSWAALKGLYAGSSRQSVTRLTWATSSPQSGRTSGTAAPCRRPHRDTRNTRRTTDACTPQDIQEPDHA